MWHWATRQSSATTAILSDCSHSRCLSASNKSRHASEIDIIASRDVEESELVRKSGRCVLKQRNLQHKRGSCSLSVAEDFFASVHFCDKAAAVYGNGNHCLLRLDDAKGIRKDFRLFIVNPSALCHGFTMTDKPKKSKMPLGINVRKELSPIR